AELLRQTYGRQYVVVAVRVEVYDALAVECFDQSLQRQIARRHLRLITARAPNLFAVLLRTDELLADERRRLRARAGKGAVRVGPERVRAVRHLDAACDLARGVAYGEVFNRVAAPEFQINRLAAQEVAGAGHDVDGRDASGARAHEAAVEDVDGVEYANVGLYGRGAVRARAAADVAVRVNESGHDRFARGVKDLRIRRDLSRAARADGDYLAASDDDDAVHDSLPGDGDDGRARERDGALLRAHGGAR